MGSLTRLARPALAALAAGALCLAPSVAYGADDAAVAGSTSEAVVPAVAAGAGTTETGAAWSLTPRAQLTITSPRQGATVPSGSVTFSGTAAPGTRVAVTLSGPGDPGSPGWDAGEYVLVADQAGRWSVTEWLPTSGAYRLSARTADLSGAQHVRFTVVAPTTPPPCEQWWCDEG